MISFGFVTLYPNQETIHATEIAKRAFNYDIQVYRFTPTSIEPITEMIKGERYDAASEAWVEEIFHIPTFLYDRCFYSNDELSTKSKPIMNWLKRRPTCTFLGHGLPSKWEIYHALTQNPVLAPYIPETNQASSFAQILRKVTKEHQLLLKPEKGSMGKGIIGLFLHRNRVEAIFQENKELKTQCFFSRNELKKWVEERVIPHNYLYQTYLSIQDDQNRPFDIRILLQKNEEGKWAERGRGVRKGIQNHLISNIGGGGEILSFEAFLSKIPNVEKQLLLENIDTILRELPKVLEEAFHPLFELGIDLGLAKDGSIWILDTNSKPGRKVIIQTSPEKKEELYCAPLEYCTFISMNRNPAIKK